MTVGKGLVESLESQVSDLKPQANAVIANIGLTVTDALRIMLTQVTREKKLPFEPLNADETTKEAMTEALSSNLTSFNDIKGIMNYLND